MVCGFVTVADSELDVRRVHARLGRVALRRITKVRLHGLDSFPSLNNEKAI